ncbi:MAG: thermonuclease family protein [Paracoccaceae bacterium]
MTTRGRRLTPVSLVYSLVTLIGLYAAAEHYAPHHGLTEDGCKVGFVYDGDTVELLCGTTTQTARLVGFDTPETSPPNCPEEAALGLKAKLRLGDLVAQRRDNITLDHRGWDKYGRRLVLMLVDGQNIADILIAEGLAVPYSGEARIDWCARLRE